VEAVNSCGTSVDFTRLQSITFQEIKLFTVTTARTSTPTPSTIVQLLSLYKKE
jgi:hypothetical protein